MRRKWLRVTFLPCAPRQHRARTFWQDPNLYFRLFLSDRLKRAIKEAGIKVRHMPMRKCVVVD